MSALAFQVRTANVQDGPLGAGAAVGGAAGALGEHRRTVATETKTETGLPPSTSSDTRLRGLASSVLLDILIGR